MATVSLCMVVKDEAAFVAAAINSIKDAVDEIVVVDTGSKDSTPEICRELGATVLHFEWVDDFSAARNFALDNCSSDWVFFLDADEVLLKDDLPKFQQLSEAEADAFVFLQKNFSSFKGSGFVPEARKSFDGFFPSFIVRMFRTGKGFRFVGPVHETVLPSVQKSNAKLAISPIAIYHFQELKGPDVLRDKQLSYAKILESTIDSSPDKAKAWHDIGIVAYRFSADYKKAVSCYHKSLAIRIDPIVLNDLGSAYIQLKDYKSALDAFGKSINLVPNSSVFHNIGLLQETLGDKEAAALAFEGAARLGHPAKDNLLERARRLRDA